MQTQMFMSKPFEVNAVQITLENIDEVASWSGGTIEQMTVKLVGAETQLPCIRLDSRGNHRNPNFKACLGYWIVERKGNFRIYKPHQFEQAFDVRNGESPFEVGDHVEVTNELVKVTSPKSADV